MYPTSGSAHLPSVPTQSKKGMSFKDSLKRTFLGSGGRRNTSSEDVRNPSASVTFAQPLTNAAQAGAFKVHKVDPRLAGDNIQGEVGGGNKIKRLAELAGRPVVAPAGPAQVQAEGTYGRSASMDTAHRDSPYGAGSAYPGGRSQPTALSTVRSGYADEPGFTAGAILGENRYGAAAPIRGGNANYQKSAGPGPRSRKFSLTKPKLGLGGGNGSGSGEPAPSGSGNGGGFFQHR